MEETLVPFLYSIALKDPKKSLKGLASLFSRTKTPLLIVQVQTHPSIAGVQ